MPINGNTDINSARPTGKTPYLRIARGKSIAASNGQSLTGIGNNVINVDSTFAFVNSQFIFNGANNNMIGANISGNNIRVGTIVTAFNTHTITGNTFITINPGTVANIKVGDMLFIGNNITFKANSYQATYNTDTVLVTDTRKANLFSNGVGIRINTGNSTGGAVATGNISITPSTGWIHTQTGIGGRAGRIQIETLIAQTNAQALNTLSGNTSNANVYYAGV